MTAKMDSKQIRLLDVIGASDAMIRGLVDRIREVISDVSLQSTPIELDFSNLRAVSRGFIQELKVLEKEIKEQSGSLTLVNTSTEVQAMIDAVSITEPKQARPDLYPEYVEDIERLELF